MLINTKITVIFIFILASFLSGCTLFSFFEETEFSLISSNIIDDEGFTNLYLEFNTTDKITVKLVGPNKNIIFSDEYYKGTHDVGIPLEEYRKTPLSGEYNLKVYDKNDKNIFKKEVYLINKNLTILNIIEKYWFNDNKYDLVGLKIKLKNNGNVPIYPNFVNVTYDEKKINAFLLPTVILPYQSDTAECFIYLEDLNISESQLELFIENSDGYILATEIKNIEPFSNTLDLEFIWRQNKLELPDVDFLYDYYSNIERIILEDYAVYIFDMFDDEYINFVAEKLLDNSERSDDVDIINFAASFVQSLKYAEDDEDDPNCEYPKFPVEMLKDAQGDCEDKAMLTAAILDSMGYNLTLIRLPNHMAVGVHLDEDIPGFDYYVNEYYFLETTQFPHRLGRVPEQYKDITNITIHTIENRPVLTHSWKNATRFSGTDGSDFVKLSIIVENLGSNTADNIEIQGAFYNQNGIGLNKENINIYSLDAGDKKLIDLEVDVPQGISTTLKTKIILNGTVVHEKESSSNFP